MTDTTVRRKRFSEAMATLRGALMLFTIFAGFFIVFGVISLGALLNNGPNEPFILGHTGIPKWQGAGATNLSVFIFSVVGFIAVIVAIAARYHQHKDKLEFLRSQGVTDFNKDGKPDSFADRFLDDL